MAVPYSPGIRTGTRPYLYIRRSGSVRAFLHGLDIEVSRGTKDVAVAVAEEYRKALVRRTPVGNSLDPRRAEGPGALKRGWFLLVLDSGPNPRVLVLNKQKYLKWVLRGRAAIDQRLKPKSRRWPLHFYIGSRSYYRWFVKGVAPNDFDRQAILAARRPANKAAENELRKIVRRAKARAGR